MPSKCAPPTSVGHAFATWWGVSCAAEHGLSALSLGARRSGRYGPKVRVGEALSPHPEGTSPHIESSRKERAKQVRPSDECWACFCYLVGCVARSRAQAKRSFVRDGVGAILPADCSKNLHTRHYAVPAAHPIHSQGSLSDKQPDRSTRSHKLCKRKRDDVSKKGSNVREFTL